MARTTLLTSALVLTLAAAPAAALAQDSGNAGNGTQGGTARAQDLTCAQLTAMDTATVPGVLYFISGYGAGQQDTAGMPADGGMDESEDASAEPDAPQESGNAAQQAATESNGASGDGLDNDTADGEEADAMGDANLARVTGFFEIPVERLVVACQDAPDQRVSDMLNDQARNGAAAPSGDASDQGGQATDSDNPDANTQAEPEVEESTPEQSSAGQESGDDMDANTQAEPEIEESTPEQGENDDAN